VIEAVLIDWGDTLMLDLPGNEDLRMADWPLVEAMPHAVEALTAVGARRPIYVASNTDLSDAPLVLAALERVGLDGLVAGVFTSLGIGAVKPEPAFFAAALEALGLPPDRVVMVGDSYPNDIAGGRRAGLWTVWYNPALATCPAREPLHDAEISDLRELPAAIETLSALAVRPDT
jgi:putative hydrolase of the HAD superfamily